MLSESASETQSPWKEKAERYCRCYIPMMYILASVDRTKGVRTYARVRHAYLHMHTRCPRV